MFETNINKIIQGNNNLTGMRPRTQDNAQNASVIVSKITKAMDMIPEVKRMTGNVTVQMNDGSIKMLKFNYK